MDETIEWILEKAPHFERAVYSFRTAASVGEWPKKAWGFDEKIKEFNVKGCRLHVVRQTEMEFRFEYQTTGVLEEFQRRNNRVERATKTFRDEIDLKALEVEPTLRAISAGTAQIEPPLWVIRLVSEPLVVTGDSVAEVGLLKFTNRELGTRVASALKHLRSLCRA